MRLSKPLFLIGFSGCGKTTLGPKLARRLHTTFIDTDQVIEHLENMTVSDIFARRGERYFRKLEEELLKSLCSDESGRAAVIALGGGTLMRATNRNLVKRSGTVVYLRCAVRELYRRLSSVRDRPLLRTEPRKGETPASARMRRLRELLAERAEGYGVADFQVSTTARSVDSTIRLILDKLAGYQ
jgi:shikimate kinase